MLVRKLTNYLRVVFIHFNCSSPYTEQGAEGDFTVKNLNLVHRMGTDPPVVSITLRIDYLAQEPDETFQLKLIPAEDAASMLSRYNGFLMDTINVSIIDQDCKPFHDK